MGRTGPPLQTDQDSIKALGTTFSEPVVSDLDRAGRMLGCPPDRLEDAVAAAGLAPWGEAASGAAVFRWPELLEAAAAAGIQVPKTRPTLAAYHERRQAKRERLLEQGRRRSRDGVARAAT
jgi:hypothetical protein